MVLLPTDHVHLWCIGIDALSARDFHAVLSADERERAARYRFDREKSEFVIVRGALRRLLSAYIGVRADSLCFNYGGRGKPGLEGDVHFSVSRTAGSALIGISRLQIGIDIERVDKEFEWKPVARHFLSAEDQAYIDVQSPGHRRKAFFRCWTRCEAFVKGLGAGLQAARAVSCVNDLIRSGDGSIWCLRSITALPGYAAAVAAEGERLTIEPLRLESPPHWFH